MDQYYIAPPWGTEAYICPNCKEASFRLYAYCPNCGTKQDPRKVFKPRADRPPITNIQEMQTALEKIAGLKVRLWDYCVSHSVLQLRVAHTKSNDIIEGENTLIICGDTKHIMVLTLGWNADLKLEVTQENGRNLYRISDNKENVQIECGAMCIYEKMPAHYFM